MLGPEGGHGLGGELVGRAAELHRIEAACAAVATAPQALLLEGPPGIGKSAVWRAGLQRAADRGLRTLVARPAESEASLALGALGDLLGGAVDEIGGLPEPQRRALRVALLLEDPQGLRVDTRSLFVAVLGLLRELSRQAPLVVAVDDVQWLDPPTAGALAFALRRLDDAPVFFLGAARPSAAAVTPRRAPPLTLASS